MKYGIIFDTKDVEMTDYPWLEYVYLNRLDDKHVNPKKQFLNRFGVWETTKSTIKNEDLSFILKLKKLHPDSRNFILNMLIWDGIDL